MADEYGKGIGGFTNEEDRKKVENSFKQVEQKGVWEKFKGALTPKDMGPAMERRRKSLGGTEK
jgi:hypothetical protein